MGPGSRPRARAHDGSPPGGGGLGRGAAGRRRLRPRRASAGLQQTAASVPRRLDGPPGGPRDGPPGGRGGPGPDSWRGGPPDGGGRARPGPNGGGPPPPRGRDGDRDGPGGPAKEAAALAVVRSSSSSSSSEARRRKKKRRERGSDSDSEERKRRRAKRAREKGGPRERRRPPPRRVARRPRRPPHPGGGPHGGPPGRGAAPVANALVAPPFGSDPSSACHLARPAASAAVQRSGLLQAAAAAVAVGCRPGPQTGCTVLSYVPAPRRVCLLNMILPTVFRRRPALDCTSGFQPCNQERRGGRHGRRRSHCIRE